VIAGRKHTALARKLARRVIWDFENSSTRTPSQELCQLVGVKNVPRLSRGTKSQSILNFVPSVLRLQRSDCWFRSDACSTIRACWLVDVVGSGKAPGVDHGPEISLRRRVETTSLYIRACVERISCGSGWLTFVSAKDWCMTDDILRIAALLVPSLLGVWTAVACRRAYYHGLPGSDALVWAGLSAVFFLLSLVKTARGLGLLRGFGDFLRDIFKQRGWYEDRRTLQITASVAVAVTVLVLVVWGLLWAWHYIKRYRLAIGFAGLTMGFGIIRFISLHEVDAWNAAAPWARTVVDLVAAAGVSAVAIARLCQLRDFSGSRRRT
jgi:hypothetical protein